MNLTEATDQDIKWLLNQTLKSRNDVVNKLHQMDFYEDGRGAYTIVMVKRGYKRVIRVSREMDGWYHYAEYCRKNHRRNPYLLKVYYLRKVYGDKIFYVAVTERLETIPWNGFERYITKDELKILTYFRPQNWIYFLRDYYDDDSDRKIINNNNNYVLLDLKDHLLFKTLSEVLVITKSKRGWRSMDLNNSNIMVRPSTKRMVILDPIA